MSNSVDSRNLCEMTTKMFFFLSVKIPSDCLTNCSNAILDWFDNCVTFAISEPIWIVATKWEIIQLRNIFPSFYHQMDIFYWKSKILSDLRQFNTCNWGYNIFCEGKTTKSKVHFSDCVELGANCGQLHSDNASEWKSSNHIDDFWHNLYNTNTELIGIRIVYTL